jgi:hypothetical protein
MMAAILGTVDADVGANVKPLKLYLPDMESS